jgi:ketol-acid reductoisomerase
MNVYHDGDADLRVLQGKTIAILGYGSQGHAHAHNLRDSGVQVVVGLPRDGRSWPKAVAAGLDVLETGDAARTGDVIMMMVPDELGSELFARDVAPWLRAGKYLAFAHGFNIHFKCIVPPADVNVFMVAPKGPGSVVRRATPSRSASPMPRGSAAPAPRFWKPRSKKRPRPISLVSRRSSAAV